MFFFRQSLPLAFTASALITLAGCNSEVAKDATSAMVGTAVEVSKGAATGIAQGIVEGRKAGESADGAVIVTKWDDLADKGMVSVFGAERDGKRTVVTLAIENKGDNPLRITDLAPMGMDGDGFVVKPAAKQGQPPTVPPKSKMRHVITFTTPKSGLKGVRVLGHDLPVVVKKAK